MRMLAAAGALVAMAGTMMMPAGIAVAKGLDQLSDENPEDQSAKGDDAGQSAEGQSADGGEGEEAGKVAATKPKSATSKALAGRLFLESSGGWTSVSSFKVSGASWEAKGGGMSDIGAGFKILDLTPTAALIGTYRYAPAALSFKYQNFRGALQTHFLGARARFTLTKLIDAFGGLELGYSDLQAKDTVADTGATDFYGSSVAFGGGADIKILGEDGFSIGPRLMLSSSSLHGSGVKVSATIIQLAAGGTFTF